MSKRTATSKLPEEAHQAIAALLEDVWADGEAAGRRAELDRIRAAYQVYLDTDDLEVLRVALSDPGTA